MSESLRHAKGVSKCVEDIIDQIVAGVRSSCTYAGAADIAQFQERAVVGVQGSAGYEEGRPQGTSW